MARDYALARLDGGPLDREVAQVPMRADGRPEWDVGFPVFQLDEDSETFWWDTANYSHATRPEYPRPGEPRLRYVHVRTLPGFPAFSRDHRLGPPR